jgi:hypothetical protein
LLIIKCNQITFISPPQIKHTTNCEPATSTKCQSIEYQECSEEPVEDCSDQEMMVPVQEKEHKKKCLLPDGAGSPSQGAQARAGRLAVVQGRNGINLSDE